VLVQSRRKKYSDKIQDTESGETACSEETCSLYKVDVISVCLHVDI